MTKCPERGYNSNVGTWPRIADVVKANRITLLAEWEESLPELPDQSRRAAAAAGRKGWRWVGEMEQIASTFESAGLPDGFHRATAEVFARVPRLDDGSAEQIELDRVLADVGSRPRAAGSAA